MSKGNGGGGFLAGLLIGAVAGAAAAVIVTQEEARDRIAGKAREAGDFAMDATDDLREKVTGVTSVWQANVS
ncbi:MAG TPA: hypothetical protein VGI15_09300, partial [Candidatus Cybelea sp.]